MVSARYVFPHFCFSLGYISTKWAYFVYLQQVLKNEDFLACVSQSILSAGVLVVLDANPKGIIYQDLIPEYVDYARTLYEGLAFIHYASGWCSPLCIPKSP